MSAVAAAFDVTTQGRRPARAYRAQDLELATAQMPGIVRAIGVAVAAEYIRDLEFRP